MKRSSDKSITSSSIEIINVTMFSTIFIAKLVCVCARAYVCACACVRACAHACELACVCAQAFTLAGARVSVCVSEGERGRQTERNGDWEREMGEGGGVRQAGRDREREGGGKQARRRDYQYSVPTPKDLTRKLERYWTLDFATNPNELTSVA